MSSSVNIYIYIYIYGWKALWPSSCRSKLQIDLWWRQQSILNLLGIKMYLRVLNTFFSLTLEPHHQRVLVFPSGGVFRTSIFLLASCAFCFHWSLVSGDHQIIGCLCYHQIIGCLCLWLVSNSLFSTLKSALCIAGENNMDDAYEPCNVSSWKQYLYAWWFWPRPQ